MRVIAGKHRGRVLALFRGEDIRPTADRVKESLFQILTPKLVGARVLDLFCGSGALGIECLSRGAAEVVFNDYSKDSLAVLKKNLARVGETGKISALDFRACLAGAEGKFDLIFSDPPYKERFLPEILELTSKRGLLKEGGLVVHESDRTELPPSGWEISDTRKYGKTFVNFYKESF